VKLTAKYGYYKLVHSCRVVTYWMTSHVERAQGHFKCYRHTLLAAI